MKKYILALVAMTFSIHGYCSPLQTKTALVVDAETNEVIYQKNSNSVRPIASITKLMTAVVVLETNQQFDEIIEITDEDITNTMIHNKPTSSSLREGDVLTRGELLHLTLMNSNNRAAHALGRTYPGGLASFVDAMNNKAISLGMNNTHFVDPTGLYNENVSTAQDLATLVNYASTFEPIKYYSTTKSYSYTPTKTFKTTNSLVRNNAWYIIVQKTGYIKDAGRCVVMLTTIAQKDIIIVLLNAPNSVARTKDAISLKYYVEHGNFPSKHKRSKRS